VGPLDVTPDRGVGVPTFLSEAGPAGCSSVSRPAAPGASSRRRGTASRGRGGREWDGPFRWGSPGGPRPFRGTLGSGAAVRAFWRPGSSDQAAGGRRRAVAETADRAGTSGHHYARLEAAETGAARRLHSPGCADHVGANRARRGGASRRGPAGAPPGSPRDGPAGVSAARRRRLCPRSMCGRAGLALSLAGRHPRRAKPARGRAPFLLPAEENRAQSGNRPRLSIT
jgi:hypothetical protein